MKYCSNCNKQHDESEMLSCQERGRMGFHTKYFCRDTNCYKEHLRKKSVRSVYRKTIYARAGISRY